MADPRPRRLSSARLHKTARSRDVEIENVVTKDGKAIDACGGRIGVAESKRPEQQESGIYFGCLCRSGRVESGRYVGCVEAE